MKRWNVWIIVEEIDDEEDEGLDIETRKINTFVDKQKALMFIESLDYILFDR